jgi:predicted dehydrogenase
MKRRNRIRIGIVGTGGMANAHADAFKKLRGVALEACLDVVPGRAEEFALRHGFRRAVPDLDALLEESDAVSVVTPDRFHAEVSLAVLAARRHLLCEKPLTVTLAEAKRVATAARKAAAKGVIHMVNFTYRRSSALERAMRLVRDGKLGALRHVNALYLQTWLSAPVWGHWTREAWLWRLQKAAGSGGVLADIGCHILDLATAVAGDARRVRCDLRSFPKIDERGKAVSRWKGVALDANDSAVIELELAGGAVAVIQATRWATGHRNHLRLEAHGTEGAVMLDLDRSHEQLDVCLGKDAAKAAWKTLTFAPAPGIYERFIRSIRTGANAGPSVIRGAQVQALLDACERSGGSGRWEDVRSI